MEVSRGIAQSAQSTWFGTRRPEVRILVPRPPFTSYGKLAEWLIAPDLKSVMPCEPGREGSNPSFSASVFWKIARETYWHGLLNRWSQQCGTSVQIAHLPPRLLERCRSGLTAHVGNVMVAAMRHRSSNLRLSASFTEACQSTVQWRCLESRWSWQHGTQVRILSLPPQLLRDISVGR